MKREMFATTRRYEGVKDTKAAAKKVEEIFVPLISALPGFIEYYWIDMGNGTMVSVTIFKSLAEALAANNKARSWAQEHLSSVLSPSVQFEAGPIVAYKGK